MANKPILFRGKIVRLWGLLAVAVFYISWMLFRHTLTRHARLDGGIGVLGGLYVCSHPAANFVDLLFFRRNIFEDLLQGWKGITWLVLNLVTFFLGCLMITIGAIRFV
jgi:hypothetical protein